MTDTNHTDSVEAARKRYVEMWDKGEFEWNHHEGDKLGQKPISPERIWQVFIEPTLQATQSQQVEEAVRKERDDFCTILEKLYEAGDDRKQMTWEYLMRIRSKDAVKTPNHQD